ncbi:MAG TPA: NDMA-dependent alcohol dehydrogenase [Acidimicrobiales bacterium]|jgi:NDMA-dependent alcohol dehydrogenase|nr:NDMA-dependent alcohol dehydrogenase [Acidimicrobiales bacterium]
MKTLAAVLWGREQDWQIEEIELDPPKSQEVLVKWAAAGLCHSDEHLRSSDMGAGEQPRPGLFPMVGGHEGGGVVLEVGPDVRTVQPGDHVAASFFPICGRCRMCITGHSNLCDLGAATFSPGQISDGTVRYHHDGQDLNVMAKLGTFAEHGVTHEASLVTVDPDLPLSVVALVSCGVTTGWGSAVYRAEVMPGDTVVVVGVGGVGINAVQGARMVGAQNIVAVDPVPFKQKAALDFGATHTAGSMEEALPVVTELTRGQMADAVILVPGVMYGDLMAGALSLTGKGGTCVVTGVAPQSQTDCSVNLFELAMFQKEVRGVVFGAANPRFDIPNLLALYRSGQLKLDELITKTYRLEQINQGYQDMLDGVNIRGVISFE